jgi:hypothetical protein
MKMFTVLVMFFFYFFCLLYTVLYVHNFLHWGGGERGVYLADRLADQGEHATGEKRLNTGGRVTTKASTGLKGTASVDDLVLL